MIRRGIRAGAREKLAKLLLLAGSCAVSLVAAEIYLHLFHNYNGTPVYVENGRRIDNRGRSRALYDLMAAGQEAYPPVFPKVYLTDVIGPDARQALLPLSGISGVQTAFCNELQDHIIYRSDRFGFYNDDSVWDAEPSVLIVGDSFAHGACVPPRHTIAAQMTRLLRPTITVGMNAHGPLLEYASLVEYGPTLEPRDVLWLFFEGNDIRNLCEEAGFEALTRYLEPGFRQKLVDQQGVVNRELRSFVESTAEYQRIVEAAETAGAWHSITRFRSLRAKIRSALGKRSRAASTPGEDGQSPAACALDPAGLELDLLADVLRRSRALVEGWGGTLWFVYLPQWERYAVADNPDPRDPILEAVASAALPVIDVSALFSATEHPVELFSYPDRGGHYTPEGYRLVSTHIAEALTRP